jgi:hypothetical protein
LGGGGHRRRDGPARLSARATLEEKASVAAQRVMKAGLGKGATRSKHSVYLKKLFEENSSLGPSTSLPKC